MSNISELLASMEAQFNPVIIIAALLAAVALLGVIFGASIAVLRSASRQRKWVDVAREERDELQQLLGEVRLHNARLEVERDASESELEKHREEAAQAQSKKDAIATHVQMQDERILQLSSKLEAAESMSRARQRELLSRSGVDESSALPTLKKRVASRSNTPPARAGVDFIPDDQVIPNLPEAELTANVDAYDLSDLEDIVNPNR